VTQPHLDPAVRHDMVFLFDVTDGNPNGDPDAGNRPRTDDETGQGLITDVCLKRKIRDLVELAATSSGLPADRYGIFVQAGHALNTRLEESYTATGIPLEADKKKGQVDASAARAWLTERYFDIRMFGAVMSTGKTPALGQIRGPLQVGMARSIDPVYPIDHAITRVTPTTQKDVDDGKVTEMGGKWTVPYGLYRCHLHYAATRGAQTGVTTEDLTVLYRTISNMFDHDRTATRGEMSARGLYVFSHADAFGSSPAHRLTERITVTRLDPAGGAAPRSFNDYKVNVEDHGLPVGVLLTTVLG
jgi:CRISPR-associated protein Csd2